MRARLWAPVAAVLVAVVSAGLAPPAHAATAAPALAVTVPKGALLTLPVADRFRDSVRLAVTARAAWRVDVLAVGHTSTVVLAAGVQLRSATAGYAATVTVSDRHLHRGTWTIRVRRSGHPGTTADASRHLPVGSGIARTVSVLPSATTYFPFKDGHLDTATATVTARDETGAAVPVHGTLQLAAGSHTRSATVAGSTGPATVRISTVGLPIGAAALVARVAGPAGAAAGARRTLALAATRVTKASVQSATTEVDPVIDGLADSLSVKVSSISSIGSVVPVTGSLRVIAPDGSTARTWALSTSKTQTITWDGRMADGRLAPGSYRLAVSMKGPQGAAVTAGQPVTVSSFHLPYRVQNLLAGGTGNQQGLAVSGGHVFVTTDLTLGRARIDEYDGSGSLLHTMGPLALGHAAEVAVRESTGELYVANGGPGTRTQV
ncbi:MAG: hypothetical protein QOC59_1897, partial [Microbacteriaceae bacterium]|nr:hypothetical protein [Microbacteriaceae bacterium]